MKRIPLFLVLCLLVPTFALAQPIHGHPQKAFYASPAEHPLRDAQGHWQPCNPVLPPPEQIAQQLADGTFVPVLCHSHVRLQCPEYAEFSAPLRCEFTVMLFHAAGRIVDFGAGTNNQGRMARDVVWDDTGSATLPNLTCDQMSLCMWNGHFTVDPDPGVPHGWSMIVASTFTVLENGDSQRVTNRVAVWSMIDPTAPITGEGFPYTLAHSIPFSPRRPDVLFGTNQIDVQGLLPIAPIATLWTFPLNVQRYGVQSHLPPPTFQVVADLDLHHGIQGRILQQIDDAPDTVPIIVTLDPAVLGPGTHKIALRFIQPDGGTEQASTLETFDVVVDPNAPPPIPTCQDPLASNFGGPLPCVYPPPPPPPVDQWKVVAPLIERLGSTNRFRLRIGSEIFEFQMRP